MLSRPDLAKCAGAECTKCLSCTRFLAPASLTMQKWVKPTVADAHNCDYYANAATYAFLYQPDTQAAA